jgi:hypothetical protein
MPGETAKVAGGAGCLEQTIWYHQVRATLHSATNRLLGKTSQSWNSFR